MATDTSVHNVKKVFVPRHIDALQVGDKVQIGRTIFVYGGKTELGRYESATHSFLGIENGDLVVMRASRDAFIPDKKEGTIHPAPRYVNIERHKPNSLEYRARIAELREVGLN